MSFFMDFWSTLIYLESFGVSDVLLPFIMIFTIIFAVLQKVKILGDKKNVNAIIALVMALVVVIPHVLGKYPSDGSDPVIFISRFLPYIALTMAAFFALLIVMNMFSFNIMTDLKQAFPFVTLFAVVFNAFAHENFPTLAPTVLLITVLITILLIMSGKSSSTTAPMWIIFSIILIVGVLFFYAKGWTSLPSGLKFMETAEFNNNINMISIVIFIIAVVVTRGDDDEKSVKIS
jgi:hypothetical protein